MKWEHGIKLSTEHREYRSLAKAVRALEKGHPLEEGIVALSERENPSYSEWKNRMGWFLQKTKWVSELGALVGEWRSQFKEETGDEVEYDNNPCFITWLAQKYVQNRPEWVWMGNPDYEFGNYLWVDDRFSMGVPHPRLPKLVLQALPEMSKEEFVRKVWDGEFKKLSEGAEQVGLSPKNTCPQCGGFLASFATRRKVYYACESCGYDRSEENLASAIVD